jgi:hypothetical protein
MGTKKVFLLALLIVSLAFAVTLSVTAVVAFAQPGDQASSTSWFSWDALLSYVVVGAIFGLIHDLNDGKVLNVAPHKTQAGTWDLGLITPALFGGAAGFLALSVQNIPIMQALLPTIGGTSPGVLAAAFAGYFYSKTIEIIFAKVTTATASSTASTPPSAPTPTPSPPAT